MKVLVAGDSFKGSLTAFQFTNTVADVLREYGIESVALPLSDGGEGAMDILTSAMKGNTIEIDVLDAQLRPAKAQVGIAENTFIVESAQAIGLPRLKKNDILTASSYGVGQMLKFAADNGAKNIVLTVGGTASNDGGAGMLCALGGKFYSKDGAIIPNSGNLSDIEYCDLSCVMQLLKNINVTVLSDVNNPLLGEFGATYVYARQKGASDSQLPLLESAMQHYSEVIKNCCGCDHHSTAGAGAGGGLGFASMLLPDVTFKNGSTAMLELVNFDNLVQDFDWVITGEGKFDKQSYMGKIVGNVIKHSKGKKIAVVCGIASGEMYNDKNISILLEIGNNKPDAMTNAIHYLTESAFELLRLLKQQH